MRWVLLLYGSLGPIIGQAIEPFLFGHFAGLSTVAVVVGDGISGSGGRDRLGFDHAAKWRRILIQIVKITYTCSFYDYTISCKTDT